MQSKQIFAVMLAVVVLLSIVAFVILLLNPFGTLPTVRVVDAFWELTPGGYVLHLFLETTGRIHLTSIDAGGSVHEVTYEVLPPRTNLSVYLPVGKPHQDVTLHFSMLPPVKAKARYREHLLKVEVAAGRSKIFLVGSVPKESTLIMTRIPRDFSVAVVTYSGHSYFHSKLYELVKSQKHAKLVELPDIGNASGVVRVFEKYRTLLFKDVFPEPQLLQKLLSSGKTVILHSSIEPPGRLRFRISNGSVYTYRVDSEGPESDYFGIYCVKSSYTENPIHQLDILNKLSTWLGTLSGKYAVVESPYYKLFQEVYARNEFGDVYLGKTFKGFYYSSISSHHVVFLTITGFFDTGGSLHHYGIIPLPPFRGVRAINAPAERYLVTVAAEEMGLVQAEVAPRPVQASVKGDRAVIVLGMDRAGKRVWNGSMRVRVYEVTYSGELVDVLVDSPLELPYVLDTDYSPFRALLIYVEDELVAVVADEEVFEPVSVQISNSEVCEAFYLTVSRRDDVNTPLTLYVNGRMVSRLWPGQTFELTECAPGPYLVEVRNVYGDLVTRKAFRVMRIYEQPFFIISVLLGLGAISMGYAAIRRRAVKEVNTVRLVFYRLPEKSESLVSVDGVVEVIDKLWVKKRMSPTLREILEYAYRRRPMMRTVAEVIEILRHLPSRRRDVVVYSRYVPELDDTVSLIGRGKFDSVSRDFYAYVVLEMMKKMGGSTVPKEYTKDVIDVDGAVILGDNLLLITYATCIGRPDEDLRLAVDRAFTSFMLIRRLRLPFTPVGFVVLTEPKYVRVANGLIDSVLSGDRDEAAKVLRDMSVFQRVSEAPRDAWISKYVMVAAPITRIAPLFAFAKMGTPKLCNHYYRFAPFAEE